MMLELLQSQRLYSRVRTTKTIIVILLIGESHSRD